MNLVIGDIILWKNIKSFGSWLQRFMSKISPRSRTIYSHFGIFAGSTELGFNQEFEATIPEVGFHTYKYEWESKCDIFTIKAPYDIRKQALRDCVNQYEGENYGFVSWVTILIRYIGEMLGFKNAHSWDIFYGWGIHCSELFVYVLWIATEMDWVDLIKVLCEYNPNTFTTQDIRNIINRFPQYFKE